MSHQTLQNQQASRKQSTEGGNAKGVVGKLDQPPIKRFEDFDPESFDKEHFIVQLQRAGEQFQQSFPQITTDVNTQAGQHNLKVISGWLKAHGVAGQTMNNLRQCVEDAFADLIFVPSAIGLSAEPATGANLIRQLTSEQWQRLVGASNATITAPKNAPKTFAEAQAQSDATLSAEEYKKAHPEAWADLRQQTIDAEKAEMAKVFDQFLQMRPAYVRSDENSKTLIETIVGSGGRINLTSLCATFDELVRQGRMKSNTEVDRKVNGVRMIDYSKTDSRKAVDPNQRATVPEKRMTDAALNTLIAKIPQMSSSEYLRHLQTNAAFRNRVNSLGR